MSFVGFNLLGKENIPITILCQGLRPIFQISLNQNLKQLRKT